MPLTDRLALAKGMTVTKRRRFPELHPSHPSTAGRRLQPHGMTQLRGVSAEQIEAVQRITLEIFADMTNAGWSLRDILVAVYLSGAHHAQEVMKEKQ